MNKYGCSSELLGHELPDAAWSLDQMYMPREIGSLQEPINLAIEALLAAIGIELPSLPGLPFELDWSVFMD